MRPGTEYAGVTGHAAIEQRLGTTLRTKRNNPPRGPWPLIDYRQGKVRDWRVYTTHFTLARVGDDITSSLRMMTTTELCSHN